MQWTVTEQPTVTLSVSGTSWTTSDGTVHVSYEEQQLFGDGRAQQSGSGSG